MTALACSALATFVIAWASEDQALTASQQQPKPKFDVASVKPCAPNTVRGTFGGTAGAGRVAYTCQPLENYINDAYRKKPMTRMKIEGGPSWISRDLYQITAKSDSAPPRTAEAMLQAGRRAAAAARPARAGLSTKVRDGPQNQGRDRNSRL